MRDHTSWTARRRLLGALALLPLAARAQSAAPAVEVYKSPSCGCCKDWIKHLQDHGFTSVRVHDTGNNAARARLGMPAKFGSCHTATVDGYVLEGHVPAADVRRLLRERPAAVGLAVPTCRSAHREWMRPTTATGAIRTTCCWSRATARRRCSPRTIAPAGPRSSERAPAAERPGQHAAGGRFHPSLRPFPR